MLKGAYYRLHAGCHERLWHITSGYKYQAMDFEDYLVTPLFKPFIALIFTEHLLWIRLSFRC